jgi:hypothetical protein
MFADSELNKILFSNTSQIFFGARDMTIQFSDINFTFNIVLLNFHKYFSLKHVIVLWEPPTVKQTTPTV